jgi:uncharacterized membrane protein YdjX (TVP38/TMEM64 family)
VDYALLTLDKQMPLPKVITENKKSILYTSLMGVGAIVVSTIITYYAARFETEILAFEWHHWLIFYLITSFTMAFAMTPTTFIALLSGYFLGWSSLPGVCISYLLASYIGYQVATFIDNGKFMQTISEKKGVKEWIDRIKTSQWSIIILARLSPILPFAIMNVVLSIVKTDLTKFIICSFVGMFPRTVMTIWVGSQASAFRNLMEEDNENPYVRLALIALIVVSFAGLFYYGIKAFRKTVEQQTEGVNRL